MSAGFDLASRLGRVSPVAAQVYGTVREKNVPFMAGSVAFYTFVSLLPLFVLLYLVVAFVGGGPMTDRVVAMTESFLPSQGQRVLADALQNRGDPGGESILGVAVLLWGAFRLFRGLDTAFSEIYDSSTTESLAEQLGDAVVAFAVLVVAVVAGVVATAAFSVFPDVPYVRVVSALLLATGLTLAFFPIFYLFPNVEVTPREVLPGVVVAAVGWTLMQSLFQVYLSFASSGQTTELLGGVLVLLTWLYFGSLAILLGAVLNAVLAGEVRARRWNPGRAPA